MRTLSCIVCLALSLPLQAEEKPASTCTALPPNSPVQSQIAAVRTALKDEDAKELAKFMHPRLRVSQEKLEVLFRQIRGVLGGPVDLSPLRAWELRSSNGAPTPVFCADEGVTLLPHFGYEQQYAVWLQGLGTQELGRVYYTLVPKDGGWKVGFLNFQKWTHGAKEASTWLTEAQRAKQSSQLALSYIKADIAEKLVAGNEHLQLSSASEVAAFKQELSTRYDWSAEVKKLLQPWPIAEVSTSFVDKDVGLVLRVALGPEHSGLQVSPTCEDMRKRLQGTSWFSVLAGVRCRFYLPGEVFSRESRLGSLYLPSS